MFIIHPSWALPIPVVWRGALYFGLIAYFAAFAYVTSRLLKPLSINLPAILCPDDFLGHVKDNAWLLIVCFIAALLHFIPISSPIYLVGDEAVFIQNGLWIYDTFGAFWHKTSQYAFWIVIVLTIVIVKIKSAVNNKANPSQHNTGWVVPFLLFAGACLAGYFFLLKDMPYHISLIREPPIQKILYQISFYVLGINYIGPRLCQLLFYIFGAVYLYKTVNLFSDKRSALLGTSIYLFSPIIFDYAHFAELASGVVLFIIIISYYFLRYLNDEDNRSLLLCSYFIGTGFLYKRDIFLMFFICAAYLVFHKFRSRELRLLSRPLKILSLPLFPIIPWLVIGKFFNWRNAWVSLSRFTSFDIVTGYLLTIPAQLSWIMFILFVISFFYVFISKRNHLSIYLGFLFISYYCFYTSQEVPFVAHRFSMAFYPTIAVFLSLLLADLANKMKWKHTFKLLFSVLTVYLILLCTVPSFSERLITYRDVKAQYFPNEQAMQWVRDNVKDGEKILSFRFKPDLFYRDKYGIDEDKIISYWYGADDMETQITPQELKAYCIDNNISYVMFPYGPQFFDNHRSTAFRNYLKENNNNEFIEVAKFNLKDNYIRIVRIKE